MFALSHLRLLALHDCQNAESREGGVACWNQKNCFMNDTCMRFACVDIDDGCKSRALKLLQFFRIKSYVPALRALNTDDHNAQVTTSLLLGTAAIVFDADSGFAPDSFLFWGSLSAYVKRLS